MCQVHEQQVKKSVWGDRLKQMSWRVDIKTKSRHIDQLNTPTGIIELQLGKEEEEKVYRWRLIMSKSLMLKGIADQMLYFYFLNFTAPKSHA